MPGYKQIVSDKWNSFSIEGWGGYVLKENHKLIKPALKEWHLSHSSNIPTKLNSLKARYPSLMTRGKMRCCLRRRLMKCRVLLMRFTHCLVLLLALVCSSLDCFGKRMVTQIQKNFTQFFLVVGDAI